MGCGKTKTETVVRHGGMAVVTHLVERPWPVRGRILFVNGAIATLPALRWAEQGLRDFELVMFDSPMVGLSGPLNPGLEALGRCDEAAIVVALTERYAPDYLISLSWGGTAALTALAARPPSVRRAIVSSFSYGAGEPLKAMCRTLVTLADAGEIDAAAALAVGQLGECLPDRLKAAYLGYFSDLTPRQIAFIVRQMRDVEALSGEDHRAALGLIGIPVMFGNGGADRFTPPQSARPFAAHMRDAAFLTIPDAGHFLAIESRHAAGLVCDCINDFFAEPAFARARAG